MHAVKETKVLRIVGLMLVVMFQEARDDVRDDVGMLVCLDVVTSVRWKQALNAAKPVLCS